MDQAVDPGAAVRAVDLVVPDVDPGVDVGGPRERRRHGPTHDADRAVDRAGSARNR